MKQSDFPSIGIADVSQHIEAHDASIVDLRASSHGDQIYGSIRYDPKKLAAAEKLVLPLPKGSGLIVLYDEDGKSERLVELATKLSADGYGDIALLEGGFDAWKAAEGRMQERAMEQPIPDVTEHQISR